MARKVVFLDRDGVLNQDPGNWWVTSIDEMQVLPGVAHAISRLNCAGYACVVVTNQSAIERGIFTEEHLETMHRWMLSSARSTACHRGCRWMYMAIPRDRGIRRSILPRVALLGRA